MVIYGLGNNTQRYFTTRHNVGRLLLEALSGENFTTKDTYLYRRVDPHHHLLTSGFMNESGLPLVHFTKYFKPPADTLLILQDDSDQLEGRAKLVKGGGSAGHHGINSIYRHLVATDYDLDSVWRLKIGIRPEGNRLKSETFVLKPNSALITQTLRELATKLQDLPAEPDWARLQTVLNTK